MTKLRKNRHFIDENFDWSLHASYFLRHFLFQGSIQFKGTGIRTMRRLMTGAGLSMPTFESDRTKDTFTIRLLLHKFFDEGDVAWLSGFGENLTQGQRSALIFAREVGAVDTLTYMQIVGEKRKLADSNLDFLKKMGVLKQKGKTVDSVYYVLNSDFDVTTPPSYPPR